MFEQTRLALPLILVRTLFCQNGDKTLFVQLLDALEFHAEYVIMALRDNGDKVQ